MRRIILSSFACASIISANESLMLDSVQVEEKVNTKIVKDVSNEQIKSADLAEALFKNISSVSLVRRSGIANDIILRGAKKDNINILIDNAKIYGACPNRMDPPTSHILSNNIESVEVLEGPYDVENFGTLSGSVKVKTKKPTKDLKGEVNLNVGSFGYKKGSFTVSGGNDYIKLLLSASKEKSDQYKDGNGDDFLEQQKKNGTPMMNQYSSEDLDAYEKKTVLAKAIVNFSDDSELALSYNANRSENILYPNTPMDADYDDSDIYTMKFTQRNLSDFSKELNLEYYYSKVDHPMSIRKRNNANNAMKPNNTNNMESSIKGLKVKNSMDILDGVLDFGLDGSIRNWEGYFSNDNNANAGDSLPSTDTKNKALFASFEKEFGVFNVETGLRYDDTSIDTDDNTRRDRDFDAFNGYVFTTYKASNSLKYFAGLGKSTRVPDARELHFTGAGNDDLEQTKNYELDLGFEKKYDDGIFKTKVFYSDLEDYIYNTSSGFVNTDAKIYGIEIDGMHLLNDEFSLDYGLAYLRGKKDEALAGQSDTDLAEIPPLKANIALIYEEGKNKFTSELIAADSWDTFDEDNSEQKLSGYAVMNLKYDRNVSKNFDLTLGIDNILDKTYATTNTYRDITLIASGAGERTLLNEPGRYVYINFKYSF